MNLYRSVLVILLVLLFATCVFGGQISGVITSPDPVQESPPMGSSERNQLQNTLDHSFEEFRSNARNWSFAYHFFLFGAAILSAVAALVLKLEGTLDIKKRNNWGAALAAVSALLVTIMASGGFQRKWEANRLAAFEVRNLQLELQKSDSDHDKILERLQRINAVRNQIIVGVASHTGFEGTKEENSKKE